MGDGAPDILRRHFQLQGKAKKKGTPNKEKQKTSKGIARKHKKHARRQQKQQHRMRLGSAAAWNFVFSKNKRL